MARTIDEFGNESGSIVERKEKKKNELAMNDGASTPVGIYKKADGTKMVMPRIQPFKIRKIKKGGLPTA